MAHPRESPKRSKVVTLALSTGSGVVTGGDWDGGEGRGDGGGVAKGGTGDGGDGDGADGRP